MTSVGLIFVYFSRNVKLTIIYGNIYIYKIVTNIKKQNNQQNSLMKIFSTRNGDTNSTW